MGISNTSNVFSRVDADQASSSHAKRESVFESADAKQWIRVAYGLDKHASVDILGREFETQLAYLIYEVVV